MNMEENNCQEVTFNRYIGTDTIETKNQVM